LLGSSSIKKQLEKSEQALDAANLDLEQKINENEMLHEELVERQKDFTDNINGLLKQIQDLEKKEADMQEENQSLVQSQVVKVNGTSDKTAEMKDEIQKLKSELEE
jgi:chromosome segregation ATPase